MKNGLMYIGALCLILFAACSLCACSTVGAPGVENSSDFDDEGISVSIADNTNTTKIWKGLEDEWPFSRTIAREVHDDGWCYCFVYERAKEGYPESPTAVHYQFYGINLRYRYNPQYVVSQYREVGEKKYIERYTPRIMRWGDATAAQKHDSDMIWNEILVQSKSVEEMLAINPEKYVFQDLDRDLFFRLMREALTGEHAKETKKQSYADKPSYSMMIEPEYIDGYKFQVAFIGATGYVEEIFIDVIYETGTKYEDYVQLSDLVDAGTATEEQKQVMEKLKLIANGVRGTDDFMTQAGEYEKLTIGGIDFSRLYAFMKAIDVNEYSFYLEDPVTLSLEEITP